MEVTVKIRSDVALRLAKHTLTGQAQSMLRELAAVGLTMEPLHPGTEDQEMMTFFVVRVPDWTTADKVIARLNRFDWVEAAYVKSPEAAP